MKVKKVFAVTVEISFDEVEVERKEEREKVEVCPKCHGNEYIIGASTGNKYAPCPFCVKPNNVTMLGGKKD